MYHQIPSQTEMNDGNTFIHSNALQRRFGCFRVLQRSNVYKFLFFLCRLFVDLPYVHYVPISLNRDRILSA